MIATWLSDLIKENYPYALKSVDKCSSEHTDLVNDVSFLNDQIQHTVGYKAATGVTDIRFARLAKVAANATMVKVAAHRRYVPMSEHDTRKDFMVIAHAMHTGRPF